jgi:hypothetical protein
MGHDTRLMMTKPNILLSPGGSVFNYNFCGNFEQAYLLQPMGAAA